MQSLCKHTHAALIKCFLYKNMLPVFSIFVVFILRKVRSTYLHIHLNADHQTCMYNDLLIVHYPLHPILWMYIYLLPSLIDDSLCADMFVPLFSPSPASQ